MDIYKAERNKTLVVIHDIKLSKKDAIREANKHFHTKLDNLKCSSGTVYNDELYLEPRSKGKTVWVVTKK